jgi:hypothetical protein
MKLFTQCGIPFRFNILFTQFASLNPNETPAKTCLLPFKFDLHKLSELELNIASISN